MLTLPSISAQTDRTIELWTAQYDAVLKQLWDENKVSARVIAETINSTFGTHYTRNAVIGRVHRLDLAEHKQVTRASERKPRARYVPRFIAAQVADTEIPQEQRLTLLELNNRKCRWPVGHPGDDDFFFCGGVVHPGFVYCECHVARAYDWNARNKQRRKTDDKTHHSSRTRTLYDIYSSF